jgi:hypothetical protein
MPMRSLPTTKSKSCSRTDGPFRRGEEGEHRVTGYSDVWSVQAQGSLLEEEAEAPRIWRK